MFGVEREVDSGQLCGEQLPHNVVSCHVGGGGEFIILTYVWY